MLERNVEDFRTDIKRGDSGSAPQVCAPER